MRSIIFDMDGTLIDSSNVIVNTINYVRQNIGLDAMEKSYMLQHINDPYINGSEFFYGTESYTDRQNQLFEDYYHKNCITDIELYPEIRELLKELKSDGRTMFVATNASDYFAKKMLNHTEIDSCFKDIVGANLVQNPKPHPDMINKLITDWSLKTGETILIGDSKKDTLSAQNAGIGSILVNWGFSDHKSEAISEIKDLREILF